MEYITHSPAETEELGCRLGRTLRPGTVVAYFGGLGMGKTAFTRGLAQGLGCRGRVTSPTFTIVNEYDGPTPLFHFDMYRLPDADGEAGVPDDRHARQHHIDLVGQDSGGRGHEQPFAFCRAERLERMTSR